MLLKMAQKLNNSSSYDLGHAWFFYHGVHAWWGCSKKWKKRGMWMRWENQYDPWNTLNQLKITK